MLYILVLLLWFISAIAVVTGNKEIIASAQKDSDRKFLIAIFAIFSPAFLCVEGLENIIQIIVPDDDLWGNGGGRIT